MPGSRASAPTFTVLDRREPAPALEREGADRPRPSLRIVRQAASVLVAGADAERRAALLGELASTMPEGTCFAEASTLVEVLEQAPDSRMVILTGWLEDGSPRSLMRSLGQHHPTLPVITVDAPRPYEA